MRLTVVGCSGSSSGRDSAASCYLVQAPYEDRTFSLLLDLGPGAFGALYRHLHPREVDAIALTHLHPDHCLDLCGFYVGSRFDDEVPWPRCSVYGPAGTAARITRAYEVTADEAADDAAGIAAAFDYRDWHPQQQIGPFEVATTRVAHPVEAYALRVTERATGRVLVYSGDTGPCPALVELAAGADLLLVESAFLTGPDLPANLHLTGRQAAEAGAEAGVGRVVLTHIPPWHSRQQVLAEATPHFPGPVELATPGAAWSVG